MSSINLLQKLGVYIQADFLTAKVCATICQQMDAAPKIEAGVYSEEKGTHYTDNTQRKTLYGQPSTEIRSQIATKIRALKSTLETHFGEAYSNAIEGPKFLLYQTNHFFSPHTDNQLGRKINMTIFLNNEGSQPQANGYVGGVLKLYGLMDHPLWKNKGISVPGQTGLLVAYPAKVMHEVTPIEAGQRYAVVSRFLTADS